MESEQSCSTYWTPEALQSQGIGLTLTVCLQTASARFSINTTASTSGSTSVRLITAPGGGGGVATQAGGGGAVRREVKHVSANSNRSSGFARLLLRLQLLTWV